MHTLREYAHAYSIEYTRVLLEYVLASMHSKYAYYAYES